MQRVARSVCVLLAVGGVSSAACGQAVAPPAWTQDEDHSTFARWSFDEQWGNNNGNAPDDPPEPRNPFGDPFGSGDRVTEEGAWEQGEPPEPGERPHTGLLILQTGPIGQPAEVVFTVPDADRTDRRKEYWVSVIYQGEITGRVKAFINGRFRPFQIMERENDLGDGWTQGVFAGKLSECPPFQNFHFANSQTMAVAKLDSVDIYTRCIPGPAAWALLALGGVLAWRRAR